MNPLFRKHGETGIEPASPTSLTLMIGSPNAPIQVRLYDKSKEIIESKKLWFHEVWQTESETEDIWRVELQLRREVLRQFGINTVDDVLAKVAGAWRNLTTDWMSLRLPDSSNTTRRTVHPFWSAVQSTAEFMGSMMDVKRDLRPMTSATVDWYRAHIAGCLAGFAARLGLAELSAALLVLRGEIIEHWDNHNWSGEYERKRIELGLEDVPKESGDGQG